MQYSTRVALLYGHNHRGKVLHLVESIASEVIVFGVECVDESLTDAVADCDLIVMETPGHLTEHHRQAIEWIREGSLAPIVVLIADKQAADTVEIIRAGADAVISLQQANDAIVAHCQALMRRWRTHPPWDQNRHKR